MRNPSHMSPAPCGQLAGLLLDWFAARLQDNAEKPDQVQDEKAGGLGRLLFFVGLAAFSSFGLRAHYQTQTKGLLAATQLSVLSRRLGVSKTLHPPTQATHPTNEDSTVRLPKPFFRVPKRF